MMGLSLLFQFLCLRFPPLLECTNVILYKDIQTMARKKEVIRLDSGSLSISLHFYSFCLGLSLITIECVRLERN